jgi:hypothetical protein
MTPQYNQTGETTVHAIELLDRYAELTNRRAQIGLIDAESNEHRTIEGRIVTCVNALEGVTTEELESGAFKAEIAKTLRQRDELLAALEAFVTRAEQLNGIDTGPLATARAVIAKAKGA